MNAEGFAWTTEDMRADVACAYRYYGRKGIEGTQVFDRWLASHDAEVAVSTFREAANGLQFIRVSRMDRRSLGWWEGLEDAEKVIRARAETLAGLS